MHTPALKNLLRDALEHKGFSFVEVLSDCTEVFGRKNNLGESAEMILSQKSKMRPSSYGSENGNIVDEPFRATTLPTGILTQTDRAEYGDTYRSHAATIREAAKNG